MPAFQILWIKFMVTLYLQRQWHAEQGQARTEPGQPAYEEIHPTRNTSH